MQLPNINDQQRNMLQAVLHKGSMTPDQLAELCKNAFGWSAAVIRRTQKSLLEQGLLQEQDGLLTTTITKDDLENILWDSRLRDSFEWTPPEQPKTTTKTPFFKSIWFWSTCAACVVIAVLCALLVFPPAPETEPPAVNSTTSIPEELEACKSALDKWQKLDAYQIISEYTRYGDSSTALESAEYTEYWQSGDNWIKIINFGSYSRGQLYLTGQLHQGTGDENGLIWVPAKEELTQQPYVWPMSFNWEDCNLIYKKTSKNPDETHIFFSVVVTNPEHPYYASSPYHVCFTFDKRNQLESISVAMVSSNADSSISATVNTYRLVSEDADAIAQYIDAQVIAGSDDVPEEG